MCIFIACEKSNNAELNISEVPKFFSGIKLKIFCVNQRANSEHYSNNVIFSSVKFKIVQSFMCNLLGPQSQKLPKSSLVIPVGH